MRSVARWFARQGLLYLAILLGLWLVASGWLASPDGEVESIRRRTVTLERGAAELESATRVEAARADASIRSARGQSAAAVAQRRERLLARVAELEELHKREPDLRLQLVTDPEGAVTRQRRGMEIELSRREADALDRVHTAVLRFEGEAGALRVKVREARAKCEAAHKVSRDARRRGAIERLFRPVDRIAAAGRASDACRRAIQAAAALRNVRRDVPVETISPGAALDGALASLRAQMEDDRRLLAGSVTERVRLFGIAVRPFLPWAFAILAALWIGPFTVRALCWFILAPIVEQRPAIRLLATRRADAVVLIPPPSRPSVEVRLRPGEELLVRENHLRSSAAGGEKADLLFHDRRHPFRSLGAGLVSLIRLRGDGDLTTVSAGGDALAEVALVELPVGAVLALRPRVLVALAQPIGRPARIVVRWRWRSLHAWLGGRFRFVLLHGPARLVVKGGRGVRVEAAERGRVLGEEQLIGFSADLALSVARAETPRPYLFGRGGLFRDKVADGSGVLLIEEAPEVSRGRTRSRGPLEGAADAAMKVAGL